MTAPTGPWLPQSPVSFIDRRSRLTRDSGLVQQNVRAWRGVVARQNPDESMKRSGWLFDHCPHAHIKASAARKCAVAAAKRLNRAIANGETWAAEVGK